MISGDKLVIAMKPDGQRSLCIFGTVIHSYTEAVDGGSIRRRARNLRTTREKAFARISTDCVMSGQRHRSSKKNGSGVLLAVREQASKLGS